MGPPGIPRRYSGQGEKTLSASTKRTWKLSKMKVGDLVKNGQYGIGIVVFVGYCTVQIKYNNSPVPLWTSLELIEKVS
jgi:hypothetical protein